MILKLALIATVSAALNLDQNPLGDQVPKHVEYATYNATEVERCLNGSMEKVRYWSTDKGNALISIKFFDEHLICSRLFNCLKKQNPQYRIPLVDHAFAEREESLTEAEIGRNGLVTLHGEIPLAEIRVPDSGDVSSQGSVETSSVSTLSDHETDTPDSGADIPRRLVMLVSPLMRWLHGIPTWKRSQP